MSMPWRRAAGILASIALLAGCESARSPSEPSPGPCTYTLSTSSLEFAAAGGSATVTVTTASHCTWTAASDQGWLSIGSGATGTGPGTVSVAAAPNPTTGTRSATLTVAGRAVAVREEGVALCAIDISPRAGSFSKDAATGTIAVTAAAHCPWTATSNADWLTVMAGGHGTGAGTIAFAVARNTGPVARNAMISVGETTFTVTQAGDAGVCTYSVMPLEFRPCMTAGPMTVNITAPDGCTWTAAPGATWMMLSGGAAGSGSGVVTFSVTANWDAPRQGAVMLRWPTPTAGQNVQVFQAGCYYSVSTTDIGIGSAGGTGRFDVYQQSDPILCGGPTQNACLWTAEADAAWITVTTSMPQVGDNPVSFTAAANPHTTARTATIRVRNQAVHVTQSGR